MSIGSRTQTEFTMVSLVALAAFSLGLTGCGGAPEFGMAVQIAPERWQPVEPGVRNYPQAKPFNVHDAQRSSTGDADAQSYARPDGKALCAATAKGGGTAWSEFQLGQVLDNHAKESGTVIARIQVKYLYRTDVSESASVGTNATLGLKVYVKDSKQRILRKLDLLTADNELGPTKGQQTQTHEFVVDLEPDLVYQYVLAGRAEVRSAEKTNASTRLEIQSFKIEIETKPTAG